MSIYNFAENMYLIELRDDAQEVDLGSFTKTTTTQLDMVRIFVYLKGSFSNESITLYLKNGGNTYSSTFNLSDVTMTTDDWIGWLRFDFGMEFLEDGNTYAMSAITTNYTRSASKDISISYDFPVIENTQTGGCCYTDYGIKFKLFGGI